MTGFKKIVNPCTCNVYGRTHPVNAYAKIKYDGTRLGICGVVALNQMEIASVVQASAWMKSETAHPLQAGTMKCFANFAIAGIFGI